MWESKSPPAVKSFLDLGEMENEDKFSLWGVYYETVNPKDVDGEEKGEIGEENKENIESENKCYEKVNIDEEETRGFRAELLKCNLSEWHFAIKGLVGSEFEDGIYHAKVKLSPHDTSHPPAIAFLTPDGRFEVRENVPKGTREYQDGTAQVPSALHRIRKIMSDFTQDSKGDFEHLRAWIAERKIVQLPRSWYCPSCGKTAMGIIHGLSQFNSFSCNESFLETPPLSPLNVASPVPPKKNPTGLKIVLDKELGYGSCGRVYLANATPIEINGDSSVSDHQSGPSSDDAFIVAVKKSRASLRLKRTMLQHESQVLLKIQGHFAIPKVFGYGRLEHFEYIAMEHLGEDVKDVATKLTSREERSQWVASMAVQMLSALSHIHSLGIVHRDIKPGNILTRPKDSSKFCLIDWGCAKPYLFSQEKELQEPDFVFGTLPYASLNAHNGQDLTRRDDLISLGYTLLALLRSSLPWEIPRTLYASEVSIRRQVREKKRNWPAERLCKGFPTAFRDFLAEVLPLKFGDSINYQIQQDVFSKVVATPISFLARLPEIEETRRPVATATPPSSSKPLVRPGQFVTVRLVPRLCIEGLAIREGDPSFWYDPSISDSNFSTTTLPAVVLEASQRRVYSPWEVTLGILSFAKPKGDMVRFAALLRPRTQSNDEVCGQILEGDYHDPQDEVKIVEVPSSEIPWLEIGKEKKVLWCYAFPRNLTLFCDPEQTNPTPSSSSPGWNNLNPKIVSQLLQIIPRFNSLDALRSSDPDLVKLSHLGQAGEKWAFAHLGPLEPEPEPDSGYFDESDLSRHSKMIDWQSRRGWFDDLVKLSRARRRHADYSSLKDGLYRGNLNVNPKRDSYEIKVMFNEWTYVQSERDMELTLGDGETTEFNGQISKIALVTEGETK